MTPDPADDIEIEILQRKLDESGARLARLYFIARQKREESDRATADADREWMVGENLRVRLRSRHGNR